VNVAPQNFGYVRLHREQVARTSLRRSRNKEKARRLANKKEKISKKSLEIFSLHTRLAEIFF